MIMFEDTLCGPYCTCGYKHRYIKEYFGNGRLKSDPGYKADVADKDHFSAKLVY